MHLSITATTIGTGDFVPAIRIKNDDDELLFILTKKRRSAFQKEQDAIDYANGTFTTLSELIKGALEGTGYITTREKDLPDASRTE